MNSHFADLGVPADLTAVLERRGIESPFPIQAAVLPDALAGHDVCGCAPTGSGKTLAFGLAIALHAPAARNGRPRALVLAPTRELAEQIRNELTPLLAARGRRAVSLYGGISYFPQRAALRRGVDLIVACPGRLEDLMAQGDVDLSQVDLVVLDEADRMADMGFLPAVRRILDATSDTRQTLLFSATLDGEIDVLVKRYQHDPRRHVIAREDTKNGDVRHVFWRSDRADRPRLTAEIVRRHQPAIVFSRTRHGADRLIRQLQRHGVNGAAIHGSRTQGQRDRALRDFATGEVAVLVATDVAARGIHVDDVACVVHYDPPAEAKDYMHRSGRTGRAGAGGHVVTLVEPDQESAVRLLQRRLGLAQQLDHAHVDGIATAVPVAPELLSAVPPPAKPAPPRRRAAPADAPVPASRSARRSRRRRTNRAAAGQA